MGRISFFFRNVQKGNAMRTLSAILTTLAFLSAAPAFADCGSIPYNPDAQIYEPNQRAFITWSGEVEILVLSTDLKASEKTEVLEVIPFPSEPEVRKGDIKIFDRAMQILAPPPTLDNVRAMSGGLGGAGAESPPPAARVTTHKVIGPHDVSVIELLRPDAFVTWVEKYLKKQGVRNPVIPAELKKVLGEYIDDGYKWFAFDVVTVGDSVTTKDALRYRFKSNRLYYPLRITKTEEGDTDVRLVILTERLLDSKKCVGISEKRVERPYSRSAMINRRQLEWLDKESGVLLGHPAWSLLRIWRIRGKLNAFEEDLLVEK